MQVGLPYNATVVNMRAAPRPDNATQNVTLLEGPFSYNCTSSPNGQPLVFPGTILEEDYRTQVAPDRWACVGHRNFQCGQQVI